MLERRGVQEVEHWTRDAQLRNYIYEGPPKATVCRESSAPLRGHLCVLQLYIFQILHMSLVYAYGLIR